MFNKSNLKSDLFKYIVVLMSGTAIAQVLSYLFAPVITRLYTPAEVAELGLFLRIVGVGAAIATLRYELSLPIPKLEVHAFRLYRFAFRTALIVALCSLLIIFIPIGMDLNLDRVLFYVLLPIALLFTAIYNIGTNWSIRKKLFKTISYSKVVNSLFSGTFKVVFGWIGIGYIGLIVGMVIGIVVSCFWFLRDFLSAQRTYKISSRSPRNLVLAKEYSEFPRINLPHVLMDLGRDLLVAVLILKLFTKDDFGLYDHSYRMLRLPLVLAGMAIGQVFFQSCSEKINNKENIVPMLKKSVLTLTFLSIVPFVVLFFYGEELFAFVFGENWRGAGTFSEIMAPWFLVNFITSPISTLPMVLRKQKEFFKLAIVGSLLILGCLTIPPLFYNATIITTLWILSLTQACYLIFVIFKIFDYARKHNAG